MRGPLILRAQDCPVLLLFREVLLNVAEGGLIGGMPWLPPCLVEGCCAASDGQRAR
jgi:hypothetical protein